MHDINDGFNLSNGIKIPCIGFGTWKIADGDIAIDAIKTAILCGYRHIDTAAAYKNEESIGTAVNESGIPRDQLFITSKLWNTERGYESTIRAFENTLKRLKLDYLDLYLIHWPAVYKNDSQWQKTNSETWRAFEKLYEQGLIKAIGVSNFLSHHLKPLMSGANIAPMVNQIEFHIGFMQKETVSLCNSNNIVVEAWSPLGNGKMLDNQELIKISEKYKVSVAQLCIRWCLQNNTLPLPKSVTPKRIEQNAKVFEFKISDNDMEILNNMGNIGGMYLDPDKVDF